MGYRERFSHPVLAVVALGVVRARGFACVLAGRRRNGHHHLALEEVINRAHHITSLRKDSAYHAAGMRRRTLEVTPVRRLPVRPPRRAGPVPRPRWAEGAARPAP